MRKYIFAIDPGTTMSGVCLVRSEDMRPVWSAKLENHMVRSAVCREFPNFGIITGNELEVVIERMQGNNMPVSSDVFLTCEWIGRFDVFMREITGTPTRYVCRRDEYKALCSNIYTHNDKGVRNALVERFAYGEKNFGKGTKAAPGWFHGFSADAWSAYAIAVTYIDSQEAD